VKPLVRRLLPYANESLYFAKEFQVSRVRADTYEPEMHARTAGIPIR
jgi:hypothetical protein